MYTVLTHGTFTPKLPFASIPIAYNLSVVPIVPNDTVDLRFADIVPDAPPSEIPPVNPAPAVTERTVPVLVVFAFHVFICVSVTNLWVASVILVCAAETLNIPPVEASIPNIFVK